MNQLVPIGLVRKTEFQFSNFVESSNNDSYFFMSLPTSSILNDFTFLLFTTDTIPTPLSESTLFHGKANVNHSSCGTFFDEKYECRVTKRHNNSRYLKLYHA